MEGRALEVILDPWTANSLGRGGGGSHRAEGIQDMG